MAGVETGTVAGTVHVRAGADAAFLANSTRRTPARPDLTAVDTSPGVHTSLHTQNCEYLA